MKHPMIFVGSLAVALLALVVAIRFGLMIPWLDAPEMIVPVLSAAIGGGAAFLVAVGVAIFAGRRNSN